MSDTRAEEEAVFDRQMRLWGADAQQRIRASRVLIRGKFQGLASELAKNLVLAGVNVSIFDDEPATSDDILTNIFLRQEDIGQPRASAALSRLQEMNPFADVKLVTGKVEQLSAYKLVVSISEPFHTAEALSDECRAAKVPLIYAHAAGLVSFAIQDMGDSYVYEVEGKQGETKSASYKPLKEVLSFSEWSSLPTGRQALPDQIFAIWVCREIESKNHRVGDGTPSKKAKASSLEEIAREIAKSCSEKAVRNVEEVIRLSKILKEGRPFAPTSTICGGLFGQEVLKVVSGQAEPANNIIIFDGLDGSALVRSAPPKSSKN